MRCLTGCVVVTLYSNRTPVLSSALYPRARRCATGGRRRIPGEPKALSNKRRLTRTQERRRIEGLRILARIIARHYLAHPELYSSPGVRTGRLPLSTATLPLILEDSR